MRRKSITDPEDKCLPRQMAKPLLAWYDANRRILPWREDPAPYHVWVSEIMLQQTRVEAVIPYYLRFLEELPDVPALAKVPEERLLKLWEGLGYYSRVRNLQKGAQQVMSEYGGEIPSAPEALLKITGIGPYTAAAVASIAFGVRIPAVDGNLLRVFARLSGYAQDVRTPAAKKAAEAAFLSVFPEKRPGDMNQALMDLGAGVCLPNGAPRCESCPLQEMCFAYRHQMQEQLPKARKKKERPVQKRTVLLIRRGKDVLVRKRPGKGLLAGLYEFPNPEGHLSSKDAGLYVRKRGYLPERIRPLPEAKHVFTHLVWEMTGYEVTVFAEAAAGHESGDPDPENGFFVPLAALAEEIALPSAFQVYTKELMREHDEKQEEIR